MEFVRGIYNLKLHHRGCALAVGNFDGFHRGHRSLITKLRKVGNSRGLPVMVMIFEPQPREYFLGVSLRLFGFRDKFECFSASGIDVLLCVLFNDKFAFLDPYSFISNVLVKQLDVRLICVGDNFRFGAFREGSFKFLKKMSLIFGFEVLKIDTCMDIDGNRISSTAVRNALQKGELMKVRVLLGRFYSIIGRVVCGMKLGTSIGFPTLNILLKGRRLLICGVYAVKVYGICSHPLLGIANIGICPTVHKNSQQKLEVHLLDQSINLYGYYVRVVIYSKIRDEQHFSSLKGLRTQIKSDIEIVKKYFNN